MAATQARVDELSAQLGGVQSTLTKIALDRYTSGDSLALSPLFSDATSYSQAEQKAALGAVAIDTHGNVGALPLNRIQHTAGVAIETERRIGIADILDGVAHHSGNVHVAIGGDFSGHDTDSGGHQDLTGDPPIRVLSQHRIQDRIQRVDGVGSIQAFGSSFAASTWLNSISHTVGTPSASVTFSS